LVEDNRDSQVDNNVPGSRMSAYKPKIYRSQDGCCICKAKSSSSRFTDSGKYENDCTDCFKLAENRRGEICNACVLIVKRWKKLPRNTGKNWAHVVDARTGPGTKNIFKQKKKESPVPFEKPYKYKHVYKRKPLKTKKREEQKMEEHDQVLGHISATRPAWSPSYCSTPEFLDNSYWRRQTMCCGVVYLGRLGEAMLDQRLYQPCSKSGKHDLTLSPTGPLTEPPASLQPSPSTSVQPASPSSSSSAFSSSLAPSSIESLVEAELQAFQSMETMEAEEEEFYMDASKVLKKPELSEMSEMAPDDGDGDEGFCDRLDQKSEQFRSSLSLIAIH